MSADRKRRWRNDRTAAGRRPVKEFIDELSDADAAAVVAPMQDVRNKGLTTARRRPARSTRSSPPSSASPPLSARGSSGAWRRRIRSSGSVRL
jgi:hypothetical protein